MAPSGAASGGELRAHLSPTSREIEHFITAEAVEEKLFGQLCLVGRPRRSKLRLYKEIRVEVSLATSPSVPHGGDTHAYIGTVCPCEVSFHLLSSWLHTGQHNLPAFTKEF